VGDTPLVWTVDFDQTRIFYDRDGQHLLYKLSMPERSPIRLKDFQPYIPMPLLTLSSKQVLLFSSTAAAPCGVVPDALLSLVYRLSTDYERKWQSAGLTTYHYDIHCPAMGIVSCFTLNVSIQKIPQRLLHQ
jgi:hypothetical protein